MIFDSATRPSYFQKDGGRHRSRSRSRASSRTSRSESRMKSDKDSQNSKRRSPEEVEQHRSSSSNGTRRSRSGTKRSKNSQRTERRFPEEGERHRSTGSRDTQHSRSRSRTKTNAFSDTKNQIRNSSNLTYHQDKNVLVGKSAICSDCQKTRSFGVKDDLMSTMAVGEYCRCSDRIQSRSRSSHKYSNCQDNQYYCKMDPYGSKSRYLPLEHQIASSSREKRTTASNTQNRISPSLPPARGNCCCTPSNCIPYACFDSFVEDLIYYREAVVEFFEPQLNRETRAKRNIWTADIEITKCQFKMMSIKQEIDRRESKLKELEAILLEAGSRKYEAKNELSWAETGDARGL